MNRNETAAVLGILAATWPNQTITEQTAAVCMDFLADIDPADAMHAARTLAKREHWFPSIAQFRNEAEAKAHARRNARAATHGIGVAFRAVPPPPALMDAARQLLTEMKGKKHWHGGPHPCPVCGGMVEQVPKVAR